MISVDKILPTRVLVADFLPSIIRR